MPSPCRSSARRSTVLPPLGWSLWLAAVATGQTLEPAVTVLADFEDASVAANITEVRNVLAGDCVVRRVSIPARGRGSLAVEIGATARDVSVACDLTFREATRFSQADRIATFCWINEGEMKVAFRVRDARDQLFETAAQPVTLPNRWVPVTADLSPDKLKRVRGSGALVYPFEVEGYRVLADRLGKQTIYLDDLQIEHRVEPRDLIHGEFKFNEPARIYEPGSSVAAEVVLENRSRRQALSLSVELAWTRPDNSVLQTQSGKLSLPPGGNDFRAYQKIDFSQVIADPGLYRLVARVTAAGWRAPNTLETSIAVTPSNRRLSRGRSTLFGVRSNLLREPDVDQVLEISVARDIGANVLALEIPWRRIEPKAAGFDFTALEPLIRALTERDIVPILVLTGLPEWANRAADRPAQLAKLLKALLNHFGGRVRRCQLDASVFDLPSLTAQLQATQQVLEQLGALASQLELLSPPIRVDNPDVAAEVAAFLKEHPALPLVFETHGDVAASLQELEAFRQRGQFEWRPLHWWLHDAPPLQGAGHYTDAVTVLQYYVQAAASGVAGLIWSDLRDDDNDPEDPQSMRGLVRRDFSPKTSLLGYATAAGELTGRRCAGPVQGTPAEYESWLFIGANRQTAVLMPHANRVLPALVAPVCAIQGQLEAQSFERLPHPVLIPAIAPLVKTLPGPLFVTLALRQPESDPQLALGRPWLRLPATVFCGSESEFTIELDARSPLQQSYLEVQIPRNSPFDASPGAAALRAAQGETIKETVRITPKSGRAFERAELTLRFSLEGEMIELPVEVRPLADLRPLAGSEPITAAAYQLAEAAPRPGQRARSKVALHAAYEAGTLHLFVTIEDKRLVGARVKPDGGAVGDHLLLGIAREGSDSHIEVRIAPADEDPKLEPVYGTTADQMKGCSCEAAGATKDGARTFRIRIPATALQVEKLTAGSRLLLALRYMDDDADGSPPVPLLWGGGLDGGGATTSFRWVRLAAGSGG